MKRRDFLRSLAGLMALGTLPAIPQAVQALPPPAPETIDTRCPGDKPVLIVDKEPDSPAAISVPFGRLPADFYIEGDRYLVTFDRIPTKSVITGKRLDFSISVKQPLLVDECERYYFADPGIALAASPAA